MFVGREQAEEIISVTFGKKGQVDLAVKARLVAELEGAQIALLRQPVDIGLEGAVIEKVDLLRRNMAAFGIGGMGIGIGQKIRQQHDHIKGNHDDAGGHRQFVFAEPPPCQLPLGGNGKAVLCGLGRAGGGNGSAGHDNLNPSGSGYGDQPTSKQDRK